MMAHTSIVTKTLCCKTSRPGHQTGIWSLHGDKLTCPQTFQVEAEPTIPGEWRAPYSNITVNIHMNNENSHNLRGSQISTL